MLLVLRIFLRRKDVIRREHAHLLWNAKTGLVDQHTLSEPIRILGRYRLEILVKRKAGIELFLQLVDHYRVTRRWQGGRAANLEGPLA